MKKFNNFWPIYKNLEEETLQLTKYIQFSDDQINVYSMHIADLIMRVAVEIEALSKELYKNNGGPDVFDDTGKTRNLFFDTDCIRYLNNKWKICNREIMVSCSNFYFSKDEHRIIKPLKRANNNGDDSVRWNRAYQAVKHDRRNNLIKGNIGNLIQALGALYILNIYFRDDIFEYGTILAPNKFFDNRLGSDIFSATFADASKATIGIDATDTSIPNEEREKMDSALCIIKYTDKSWKDMHTEFSQYNNSLLEGLVKTPEFIQKLNERAANHTADLSEIVQKLIIEMQSDYIKENPPIHFGNIMLKSEKEVILNKGQQIYSSV